MGVLQKTARAIEVKRLKGKARVQYEAYRYELGQYDCGKVLAEVINPRLAEHKQKFNAFMEELALIDPEAPKFRL